MRPEPYTLFGGRVVTRQQRRELDARNRQYPEHLVRQALPARMAGDESAPVEVWRSRRFLVTLYEDPSGWPRLTIQRTDLRADGRWEDGISWDDLQRLKRECGRGDQFAVEVFPADSDVVNVANMRHLWLLPDAPPFAWRAA